MRARFFSLLFCLLVAPLAGYSQERIALVIGNAAYEAAPLTNPTNDATAFATLLREAGFQVDLRTDSTLDSLRGAINDFGTRVRGQGVKFAVFFYSGHGMQLDWRNYLIPVNARIKTGADIRQQAVDVSDLMKFMGEAKGGNYLVILDACRDDPFGGTFRPPLKGLSQFDAPPGGVLAYSTAPGRVAYDGTGKNGLYSTHLLREMAVKGARIEDAFKRTRLNVRLASKGMQVPWETTSLEQDVYLFPPAKLKLSDDELDKLLHEELNEWGKVRGTSDVHALAEFVRKYPNGNVSELAASRLNRLMAEMLAKEPEIVAAKANAAKAAEEEQKRIESSVKLAALQAEKAREEQRKAEAAQQLALKLEQERTAARAAAEAAKAKRDEAAMAAALRDAERLETARRRAHEEQLALAEAARASAQEEARAQAEAAIARARLDDAQRIASGDTAYFTGMAENVRQYAVGDEFTFRVIDRFNNMARPQEMRVTSVDTNGDRVEYNGGQYVSDLMGNMLRTLQGTAAMPRQFYPAEFVVGKRWTTRFKQARTRETYTFAYEVRVVGKERVTVPAGTFDTYRIEARGFNVELGAAIDRTIWIAPGLNADVAHETTVRLRNGSIEQFDRQELVSFKQAARLVSPQTASR